MKKLICPTCEEEFKDYHERMSDDFCLIENEYGEYYCFACGNNELEEMEKPGEPFQEDHDPVHRPQHYMQGHIETIDKIKLLLTPEEYLGYLKGNVIKYDRAPFKGNAEQDYDKQKVYYDWALEQMMEAEGMNNRMDGRHGR